MVPEDLNSHFDTFAAYGCFADTITKRYRYTLDAPNVRFLDAVLRTAPQRLCTMKPEQRLWRAQLTHGEKRLPGIITEGQKRPDFVLRLASPASKQRMLPLKGSAVEGRVNAKQIPCLYVCEEKETALAEVRPWFDEPITLATCKLREPATVVDCTLDEDAEEPEMFAHYAWGTPKQKERLVWRDIGKAFGEPSTRRENIAQYAPTQVLAERFRAAGYHGIRYRSRVVTGGTNLALFDVDAVTIVRRQLWSLRSQVPTFARITHRYLE